MEFTEICVTCTQQHKETVIAVVLMVADGIYIEDYEDAEETIKAISHVDLIDDGLLHRDTDKVIIHIYLNEYENPFDKLEFIKERLTNASCTFEIEMSKTEDADWANNWKEFYKPFTVGNSLLIKPEWESVDDICGRKVLNIEPGLAFGTGTHETTKMCLLLLEEVNPSGKTILDVGCGSGILSIASLLLGASDAIAVDIDPLAVKTTKNNGALNNFNINVYEGDLLTALVPGSRFDIILANIIADAIIILTQSITSFMKKDSVFICSGIIDERLDEVLEALTINGLTSCKILREKGWVAIAAKL